MNLEFNVSQQGDSRAISIPAELAHKRGDAPILRQKTYALPTLLSQITEANLHHEIDTGPPAGQELW